MKTIHENGKYCAGPTCDCGVFPSGKEYRCKHHPRTRVMKYIALRDISNPTNRGSEFWFSGMVRTLDDVQAKPLLEANKIMAYTKPKPKRMVHLIDADGSTQELSWGDYLKRSKSNMEMSK